MPYSQRTGPSPLLFRRVDGLMALAVESISIAVLLDRLRRNEWLIPSFQRDFVWSEASVTSLILSVIEARPIGMATLWEQPDDSDLQLVPASIEDTIAGEAVSVSISDDPDAKPNKFYAVLDGRQRSTALAMAFGGLHATDSRRRFSGRFFLDVKQGEVSERVRYVRETEVKKNKYDHLASCIADGLFPLAAHPEKDLMGQWMDYLKELYNADNYPHGLPDPNELAKRNDILQAAFKGITDTRLAVYIVPATYSLGEICEIFETLNTTGTKVSTVDLLHSWLYADTLKGGDPIQLRDWIEDLGDHEGAAGWASKSSRPEIIAQIATACYLTLDDPGKQPPRRVGNSKKAGSITALKAGDLLATPAEFWAEFTSAPQEIARYMGDFQKCVCGSHFPLSSCPYPVSVAMYVALRWYMDNDARYVDQWSREELDALFRAFFWRNALTGRYDQGFLSQSASDLRHLKEILYRRRKHSTSNSWAAEADHSLTSQLALNEPEQSYLEGRLLHAKPAGALGQALSLPLRTTPTRDLIAPETSIAYPSESPVELHHIYPLSWCANNKHGELKSVLDPNLSEFDYARSIANLTPLTRESNNTWKAKTPGQALSETSTTLEVARNRLETHFISESAYHVLMEENPSPERFWEIRAAGIAEELLKRCRVSLG